jgi:hypothetical protein
MTDARGMTLETLETGLDHVRQSPRDAGVLRRIVARPQVGQRETLPQGVLDLERGLVGDNWSTRGCRLTPDGAADRERQLTVMNARAIALIAETEDRWPLAGDQLFLDLDISQDNLPPGSRLAIGAAVIEITAPPHDGCKLFADRFGKDAVRFVNSPVGKQLRLRGLNARIVRGGTIRVGDVVKKL